jgi:hypothetical protein
MKRTTENITSSQDVLMTEIIVNQALIDILIDKQLITEEELLKSIQKIKKEQQELQNNLKKVIPLKRRK